MIEIGDDMENKISFLICLWSKHDEQVRNFY